MEWKIGDRVETKIHTYDGVILAIGNVKDVANQMGWQEWYDQHKDKFDEVVAIEDNTSNRRVISLSVFNEEWIKI